MKPLDAAEAASWRPAQVAPFRLTDVDAIDREAARHLARRLLDDVHAGDTFAARRGLGGMVAEEVLRGQVPSIYLAAFAILVRADAVHVAVQRMERAA